MHGLCHRRRLGRIDLFLRGKSDGKELNCRHSPAEGFHIQSMDNGPAMGESGLRRAAPPSPAAGARAADLIGRVRRGRILVAAGKRPRCGARCRGDLVALRGCRRPALDEPLHATAAAPEAAIRLAPAGDGADPAVAGPWGRERMPAPAASPRARRWPSRSTGRTNCPPPWSRRRPPWPGSGTTSCSSCWRGSGRRSSCSATMTTRARRTSSCCSTATSTRR